MEIKSLLHKYLWLVIGLAIVRILLNQVAPGLFTHTVTGDGFKETHVTLFCLYQKNFFNIIVALFMTMDLSKIGLNRIIVPLLTVISLPTGLFFFFVLMLNHKMNNYEKI